MKDKKELQLLLLEIEQLENLLKSIYKVQSLIEKRISTEKKLK